MAKTFEHTDKLGKPINLDDVVAACNHNSLAIGKVVKINAKMIGVEELHPKKTYLGRWNKYPEDLVILDGADVTMYMLTN